ncbi:MAG: type VII secretion protein EccCa [Actinomycetia bacterium]|nr:type VII secretion protein EccCa [Actinomycetes bacterium]
MATVVFNRGKRATPPPMPRGDLLLESPPEIPPPAGQQSFGALLRFLPMIAGMGAMGLMYSGMLSGGGMGGGRGPMGALAGGLMGLSMMGMMFSQLGRGNNEQAMELDARRRDYFRYLTQTRRQVRKSAADQRKAVTWRHPEPDTLWSLAGERRMWERRPDADDFLAVRISVGRQQFAKRIVPPESKPIEDLEPLTTGALRRFMLTHRVVPSVPLMIDIRGFKQFSLVGDIEASRRLAYAMVSQIAAWHAPTEVRLIVAVSRDNEHLWSWTKWLPHLQHPTRTDGVGPVRFFATDRTELVQVTEGSQNVPDGDPTHVVLVVDGMDGVSADMFATPGTTTSTIEVTGLRERPRRIEPGVAVLDVSADDLTLYRRLQSGQIAPTPFGKPDQVPMVYAEMLARQLSPYRMPAASAGQEDDDTPEVVFEPPKDYPAMLGTGDPLTLDLRQAWRPRPLHQRLRIPVGSGTDGRPVELDIKEAAMGGMGPHGLCIGATGSGKSEFLRTLVLGLAMTHSSEQLNYVLVDFKGGATFAGLDDLPHVSAVITNLEGELTLVDRMQDAIAGEMERRMEVLSQTNAALRNKDIKNREEYEIARQEGADIPPMPSLFIVVDEFSELLTARPEFIDLFIQIGRIGRSIGVHQLLASQRLEESKLRGLDTFLSYRIALRTFSPAESRVVIGVPDAYHLPQGPGNGYLKYDTTNMVQFKAAYVSGPWHGSPAALLDVDPDEPGGRPGSLGKKAWVPPVLAFEAGHVDEVLPPEPEPEPEPAPEPEAPEPEAKPQRAAETDDEEEDEEDDTLLGIVVNQLRGQGWPAHRVWLPPLDDPPPMDHLLRSELVDHPQRGLTTADPRMHGTLAGPVALIDRPRQQRRDPMWLDYSGAGGNLAIVGGPQAGKSMGLRAAITGLALTHTPAEVGFYCLDFGGGSLTGLRDMPHVGSVCGRLDVDRVRRTIAEMTSLLQARELLFAELGVDGIASYRRGRRDGTIQPDRFPIDVFLVVDGWMTLRQEFEAQDPIITNLAARGLGYGLHVMLSANKWSEFRLGIRDLLQSRVELKLGDPFESEINRKLADLVPAGRPGRGLSGDGLHMLTGLPRIDGVEDAESATEGQREMITRMNAAWKGPKAAEVRMLPADLPITALPEVAYDDVRKDVPWAIDEIDLAPVMFDPKAEPHLVVIGQPECGKSTVLRVLVNGLLKRYTPKQAKFLILDYRRSLLGFVPDEYLIKYCPSQKSGTETTKALAGSLQNRVPGPDVTPQQLRDRSWWSGAEVFVIVDDYEMVATTQGNALMPLAELVTQARDIGLHMMVARGFGGAARAVGDQVVGRMRDGGAPAFIMSGTRDEGALWAGYRPVPLPPGRGQLITRAGQVLAQVANLPPTE